jgi:small conductance mechanosensitive channel
MPAHIIHLGGVLINKLVLWSEAAVAMLPNFVLAGLIFYVFYKLAQVGKNLVGHFLDRVSENKAVNRILLALFYTIILCVGLFCALEVLNLEKAVTSLLAGAGILGLTIGFAFQEIAANFFAGILIAFKKPYSIGDVVSIEGQLGTVSDISLRTTNLTTAQGLELMIPNKDMFTKALTNYTVTPDRRVDIPVGVSYAENLREVEKITVACLEDVAFRIKDRPITFWYTSFGDSSINFLVTFWIHFPGDNNYPDAIHDAILRIKEAFDAKGISIPYPIRTLDFGIKGGTALKEMMSPSER